MAASAPVGLKVAVLGAINLDTTVFEKEFAAPGEEVPVSRVEEYPGGKGANAAVASARILGPGSVAFMGALGSDASRGRLLQSLGDEGVRTEGVVTVNGAASGRAVIVVDGAGRKTIHTHFGANDSFEPKHVQSPTAAAMLEEAPVVVIMDVPLQTALAAAKEASRGSRIVYSPGVRAAGDIRRLDEILSLADDLVVDRFELAKISGEADPTRGVKALLSKHEGVTVVATLGPEGSIIGRGKSVPKVPPVDLHDLGLSPVNSTGSGDAFLAAYACYTYLGLRTEEAAEWGSLAGALKASSAETRGSPTRAELEAKMLLLKDLRGGPRGSR